ncbi:hypothetical protein GA0070611_1729 [Micromonospora auratinigra]|uniref:Uncharacterized protein n=1 Tax=Micromonospora auratinigra TaxID=261654 RepID=A0A1A8ZD06_9ACTN|nr:hypothetical protein GA0070611_1729 [Micromonospora auratinigra]
MGIGLGRPWVGAAARGSRADVVAAAVAAVPICCPARNMRPTIGEPARGTKAFAPADAGGQSVGVSGPGGATQLGCS